MEVEGAYLVDADLSHLTISDATLHNANLSGANLIGCDVANSDFSNTDFVETDLAECEINNSDLSNTDLSKARLSDAKISETDLSNASFVDANLSRCELTSVAFSGVDSTALIKSALTSPDDITQGQGADAVAVLASNQPEKCTGLVEPLLDVLETTEIPSIQATAVRSLVTIISETEITASDADALFASLLLDGTELVQEEITTSLFKIVKENPDSYLETLQAYEDALYSENPKVRLNAAKSLAIIVQSSGKEFDVKSIIDRFQQLDKDPDLPQEEIGRALGIVRSAEGAI
ncbi:pentapeptide repeat-containing protein [Haloarcula japonica]|uniref:pentapeptide repeat-containing protein n=1 Tax=Haloarcula japonica TaxID=29282 RepID=UPI0039F6B597